MKTKIWLTTASAALLISGGWLGVELLAEKRIGNALPDSVTQRIEFDSLSAVAIESLDAPQNLQETIVIAQNDPSVGELETEDNQTPSDDIPPEINQGNNPALPEISEPETGTEIQAQPESSGISIVNILLLLTAIILLILGFWIYDKRIRSNISELTDLFKKDLNKLNDKINSQKFNNDRENSNINSHLISLQSTLSSHQSQLDSLQQRIDQLDADLINRIHYQQPTTPQSVKGFNKQSTYYPPGNQPYFHTKEKVQRDVEIINAFNQNNIRFFNNQKINPVRLTQATHRGFHDAGANRIWEFELEQNGNERGEFLIIEDQEESWLIPNLFRSSAYRSIVDNSALFSLKSQSGSNINLISPAKVQLMSPGVWRLINYGEAEIY
ncbi:hypothetical protein GS597_07605 [Synechococcales cyanobacterium C]|uniref:Uncharacterized protein n=1 Tax=Petrachloros mirabilis ULC683 TaxID=2781853 RepID=A0A8K1ZYV8_9CYAN|nr:hypothetical protein [Petrachloros mirabilis]NCJ06377.1 hypothetical protein [Petrachloros mirabilis ULC683]